MIYTLTLNPSVDYVVGLEEVQLGNLNRSNFESKFPGGKGINVSRVLKRFGVKSKALGFIGGFTGNYIENHLKAESVESSFVHVEEDTRINIKIKANVETEINARGPKIEDHHYESLKKQIAQLTREDILVISGSIPSSMPQTAYLDFVRICRQNETAFVVDAGGELLDTILSFEPFLIKPNHHELGELFGVEITTIQEVIPYGKKLIERGAKNVIISMADKGAVFLNKNKTVHATVPKGKVKSSVGAGDSMVAGFLASYLTGGAMDEAFRLSVATGSATAFSMDLCTKEYTEEMLTQVTLRDI